MIPANIPKLDQLGPAGPMPSWLTGNYGIFGGKEFIQKRLKVCL